MEIGQRVRTLRGDYGICLSFLTDEQGRAQTLVQLERSKVLVLEWIPFLRPFLVGRVGEPEAVRIEQAEGFDATSLTLCYTADLVGVEA